MPRVDIIICINTGLIRSLHSVVDFSVPEHVAAVFGVLDQAYHQATVVVGVSCVTVISLKKIFEDIVVSAEVYACM